MEFGRERQAGVTLMELLVALAVAATLLALAVPSFIATINRSRLAGGANELVVSLQTARMEALRRNASVVLCNSADQLTCASGGGRWSGWIVLVPDANRDGVASDPLVLRATRLGATVSMSSSLPDGRVTYRPDGFARAESRGRGGFLNASFDLCIETRQPAENVHRVSLFSGGRLTTQPIDANGVCAP
ncbi:GspH/FimT family pseudopilin [Lysobacter sp. K5869]|uniref:GspH/FimT family pseudopilin n=1 Tax=Lysobacter sp. K5869 TaxID=2820808 RepID=UPI001C06348E|nr:GspH/FimT family pseudopilin [Lysobacter sp. K5869]QWP79014.1 GspH/FimT family pseudopilin [Lysobacter sp. K5869]